MQEVRDAYGNVAWRRTPEDAAEADVQENGENVPNTAESVQGTPGNVGEKGENVQQSMPDEQPHNNGRLDIQERPLLWERGAYTAPEDVATPTITTIGPPQGDEGTSRAKGQSNVSSVGKDTEESANRQTEDTADRKLAEQDVKTLLARMEADAEVSTEKELTAQTWSETFDEGNSIETPIGRVKMGDNQITKFFEKKRTKEFGMVAPTLKNPDVIIAEESAAKDGNTERDSSYLFVKTFNRNGEKIKFYASITVKKDGMEVSISSHYMNREAVQRKMQEGRVLYIREALLSNSSERHLAEHRDGVPDLLPTQEGNASTDVPHNSGTERSVGKDTEGIANRQAKDVDENGHPFIQSSDGTTVFGEITEDSGLTAAPIKMSEGFNNVDEQGNNIGYGLLHIQAGHGKQILEAGYSSVQEFVEDVCRNYEEIRIGRSRRSNKTYMLLELHDEKHKRTLYVELSHDGTYWNVNSGGIFRNNYVDKNDIVWPEPTMGSNAITDTAEVADSPTEAAKDETVDRGGNSSQPISSAGKVTEENVEKQEDGGENVSALSRIPKDGNGEPVYTAVDAYTAWDALVEECGGDAGMAQGVADDMVKDMEAALKKAEKSAPSHRATVSGKIAAAKEHKAAIEKARGELDKWRAIAGETANRARAAEEAERRKKRERLAAAREELQRKGRYAKEDAALGDYTDFTDYVMRTIATGEYKFRWRNKQSGTYGLGAHLGFTDSREERNRRIWLLSRDGYTPEEAAERMLDDYAATVGYDDVDNIGIDSMEALGVVLDVVRQYTSPRAMMNDAIAAHAGHGESAQERRAREEYEAEEFMEAYHMTPEEYNEYETEWIPRYMEEAAQVPQEVTDNIIAESAEKENINGKDKDNGGEDARGVPSVHGERVDNPRGDKGGGHPGGTADTVGEGDVAGGLVPQGAPRGEVKGDAKPTLGDVIGTLYAKGKKVASELFQRSFMDVAETPDFMKQLGMTGAKFTIRYGVIARHFGKDGSHNLTEAEWMQLPDALQKPFAIARLSGKERAYRLYTLLKTEKGEYVVVGVDVKNAGRDMEVNSIATVFGRRDGAGLPGNESVIYRSDAITPEQEALLGRPNSDQYPTTRELSNGKDNEISDMLRGYGLTNIDTIRKIEELLKKNYIIFLQKGNVYIAVGSGASTVNELTGLPVENTGNKQSVTIPSNRFDELLHKIIASGLKGATVDVGTDSQGNPRNADDTLKPIGKGAFGNIYDQFKGKAKEAFAFLREKGSGDALGVFHRNGVGDIDVVWGDKGGGLDHIISKHVGDGKSFLSVDEAAKEIDDIIRTGDKGFENGDKIVFKKGSKLVKIRKNVRENGKKTADKNWVLTAYDELSADGDVSAIAPANQGQAARTTGKSRGKVTEESADLQESGGKKNKEVYNRHTTVKQPVEAAETSQDVERSDTQTSSSMNVPTSSESKVINNQSELQEKGGKDAESKAERLAEAEYAGVKKETTESKPSETSVSLSTTEAGDGENNGYTITPSTYTNKPEQQVGDEAGSTVRTGENMEPSRVMVVKLHPFAVDMLKAIQNGDADTAKKVLEEVGATMRELPDEVLHYIVNEQPDMAATMRKKGRKDMAEVTMKFVAKAKSELKRRDKPNAEKETKQNTKQDNHGNPLNADGSLKLEKITSVDELTDEDFSTPTRNVELPTLPKIVDEAIGANGKPVVIKKNIFEKNKKSHKDLTPEQSREILQDALYHPNLYGQNQKTNRPYNWILIHNAEKHSSTILEVNHNKDNVEVVNWHYLDDVTLERKKRQAVKEGGLILTLESAAANTQNDLSSTSKDTTNSEAKQTSTSNNEKEKIDDVGEKIEGARKDALKELSEGLEQATEAALVALPFSKAFKRPNLKKAVEDGVLREEDAMFAQAVMSAYLSRKKPLLSKSGSRYKKEQSEEAVKEWARNAYKGVELLKKLFSLSPSERDAFMSEEMNRLAYDPEKTEAYKRKLSEWNPGKVFNGTCYPLNAIKVWYDVYTQLGYEADADIPQLFSGVLPTSLYTGYKLITANGKPFYPARTLDTYDAVVNEIVYQTKVANADTDTDHPKEAFKLKSTGAAIKEPTGKWRVVTQASLSARPIENIFDSKEEAEKFAKAYMENDGKKASKYRYASAPTEVITITGFSEYAVVLIRSNVGKGTYTDFELKRYGTKEEAIAAIDAEHEELNNLANKALAKEKEDKGGKSSAKNPVCSIEVYTEDGKTWKYGVALSEKYAPKKSAFNTMPYYLADGFATRKDAQAYLDAHREEIEAKAAEVDEKRRNFKYFTGSGERVGKNYRNGEDVTAEQFREQFGFRGVQFGNWTNQGDRQEAINQAFDAFMDLSRILGVSPKALSLNGELGIAFGARGSGKAVAHYEPAQVVINLTKTNGAGSLAHEWWHALDNYFARQGNVAMGYVTASKSIEMREELRRAFNALIDHLDKSPYNKRSRQRGTSYWGTPIEETARMFEQWVNDQLAQRGERSPFLTDADPNAEERYVENNYAIYKFFMGDKAMPYEEFKQTPQALADFVYLTRDELQALGEDLKHIFDTIQQKVDETTGKTLMYHRGDVVAPLTSEERVLRDAVIDRLREGGMDVITDVEEGQRVLDMANGEERMEAKVVSPRRQWLNSYVEAMHLATGRDKKAIRAEVEQKIADIRKETKELYTRVLSGNFDDVTLQLINNYIDNFTPYNEYWRPLSKRLPSKALRSLRKGERANSVDVLFSRISESAVPKNGRTGAEARRRVEEKKEELLKKWAIATGNWHTDVSDFEVDETPIGSGKDSVVYQSKDGKTVIKASKGKFDNRKFPTDVDQVALFNYVFPESRYEILGYGEVGGKFVKFLRQRAVDFSTSAPLTTEERTEYMRKLGFEPGNEEKTVFSNGEIVVSDLQKSNIVRDKAGNIRVIDADVKLHTRDIGGNYTYPDVETDTEKAETVREQRVYHGSGADFTEFDHSHMGEGEGAQVYGWGTYVTEVKGIGRTYAVENTHPRYIYNGFSDEEDIERRLSEAARTEDVDLDQHIGYYVGRAEKLLADYNYEHEYATPDEVLSAVIDEAEEKGEDEGVIITLRLLNSEDLYFDVDNGTRHLYTVEIPDDNGGNYIDYNGRIAEIPPQKTDAICAELEKLGWKRKDLPSMVRLTDGNDNVVLNPNATGADLYEEIKTALKSAKQASLLLSRAGFAGIKYPADNMRGGRADGAKNYVVFDEKDARIAGHVRFFRTAEGEAYGFTVGGKIYIDPGIANAETPVHEYAHLWASALEAGNPKEWRNVVGLVKGTPVWDEVKRRYPELETDDEIADEVLATYSGRRGAERLREEAKRITDGGGSVFDKAEAVSALGRVKAALERFWKAVADFLHIRYTSAEEVADRVMKDLLDGVDPRKFGKENGSVRMSAKKKRAPETVSVSREKKHQPTAVSSADGAKETATIAGNPTNKATGVSDAHAKIQTNLDSLAKSYWEKGTNKTRGFITDLSRALGLERHEASNYGSFDLPNGNRLAIRVSNHNARVSNFDRNNEDNGISIVISSHRNKGLDNDGTAHLVEFFYNRRSIENASGKPLAEIVRSIKQALYSGEFKDTTGLAEVQEVNTGDVIRFQFIGEKGAEAEREAIVASAKESGTYMKAPNGRATRLTASQWVSVRTRNFKRWFGDWENEPEKSSKVVDDNGEPMVVYHGRSADFNTFERHEGSRYTVGLERRVMAEGYFFTHDKEFAEKYARHAARVRGGKADVVACFLNIRHPMDLVGDTYVETYEYVTGWEYTMADMQDELWDIMDEEGIADKIKSKGYDGVMFAEELNDAYEPTKISYCILDANQAKYADGNNGDYSETDADMRYRTSGELEEVNERFNVLLDEWQDGVLNPNDYLNAGLPSGVIAQFMPDVPIIIRQRVLKKSAKKHGLSASDMKNLPKAMRSPIFIFKSNESTVSILTELKSSDGKNIFVAVELGKEKQMGHRFMEVNDILTIHGREVENVINPIVENNSLVWVDKEKGLNWLSSAKSKSQAIANKILDSAANVVRNFENPKVSGEKVADGERVAMENAMAARVEELSERLHTPVRIVRTNEEVAALPSERQRRMKGSFNPTTGEVTVVIPNNANMADVENTVLHEIVGHGGLRVLFPTEEKLNNALDELYRVSKDGIQESIDRMARKMYDAEVDRLMKSKRKEHEAKGENANASYFTDLAEAHVEADRKRGQFRRNAAEEYAADLAGRIGEKGFERMSAEELTFWGRLKAVLQNALRKLAEGLGIPGVRKWGDNEWAFVLHEAYKRKRNDGRPSVADAADTVAARESSGFDGELYRIGDVKTFRSGRGIEFRRKPSATFNALLAHLEKEGVKAERHKARTGSEYASFSRYGVMYEVRSADHTKPGSAYDRAHESGVGVTADREGMIRYIDMDLVQAEMNAADVYALMDEAERFNRDDEAVRRAATEDGTGSAEFRDAYPTLWRVMELKSPEEARMARLRREYNDYVKEETERLLPFTASNGVTYRGWYTLNRFVYPESMKGLEWKEKKRARKVAESEYDEAERKVRSLPFGEFVRQREQEGNLDEVNRRFNERLEEFTSDSADSINFDLGRPSEKLLSAGVADRPIRLHGSKVAMKMKKHGFSANELRDLPKAVANPIAVFNNLGREGNRSVLTELKTANGNFLVTIDLGKGSEADFDIVSSVFGKKGHSVATWINKGYMRYVDKEKALRYLHLSAPIAEASDNAELSSAAKIVENFENPKVSDGNVVDGGYIPASFRVRRNVSDEELMFRDGDEAEYKKALARDIYERRVSRGLYQTQEALQDSMLGLKEAMDAILKAEGKGRTYIEDVAGFENAYLGENRLSSVNQAECSVFGQRLFKPLLKEVARLAKTAEQRAELIDYMMAKHGLERNEVMARRDARKKASEEFEKDSSVDVAAREQELYLENRERDYAGLTALTGTDNVADAEAEARQMVADYEMAHTVKNLWDRVNAVNAAILQKSYESGMISRETYDYIRGMYKNYIPLRGFDEKTAEDTYGYISSDGRGGFNSPIKAAKGRKSKADDTFASMEAMAESAIMQGNRNTLVKQRFMNFALNHPSDLVSISDLWLWKNDATGEWQPLNAGGIRGTEAIDEDDTPAEVARKMQEFEAAVEKAAKNDPEHFKRAKDNPAIPYRVVESRDLRQHQVLVMRNGRSYILTINGNPRAAQALNGQTNPDAGGKSAIELAMRIGEVVNRELAAFYTTRNPDFVVSNFLRDMLYANTMVWVKETPNYAVRFHMNVLKLNPAKMKWLLAKFRNGTLNDNDETQRMFRQFMMNGGETGYSSIKDIDRRKSDIRREIKKYNGKIPLQSAYTLLGERLDEYNRAIENCARFAAFMTSRQMLRSIDRSIYDAKEISVNFNKKGSGAKFMGTKGQAAVGNVAAFASGWGRSLYVFFNAAVQGTANYARQVRRHPAKALSAAAVMYLLGMLMAHIGGSGDDDDKEGGSYWDLPEYVRRSNIMFRAGKQWISIPLPVEYRVLYGMGELAVSVSRRSMKSSMRSRRCS